MGSGRCWDSSVGDSVSHTSPQLRVHLHVQTDHPTARAAPGHTLPLPALPADTYTCLHTHSPLPSHTVPVHSCPTALPALVPQDTPHQCTPHQCTPHHPTVCSLFPCSLTHSHGCLLTEPGAPLPQPPLRHGPGAAGHWGDPDFWAGRTLGRATGSALVTEGPQWSVVSPVCSK